MQGQRASEIRLEYAERIYLACDVSNLWKSCREKFGRDSRLDFQVLSGVLKALRHPKTVKQTAVAYIVSSYEHKTGAFAATLSGYGFEIRERYMSCLKGLDKPLHTDWDVGITIDALDRINTYDTFALMSGDGDFGQLLKYLESKGKRTIVLSFAHATSKHLFAVANEVIPLTEAVTFRSKHASNSL